MSSGQSLGVSEEITLKFIMTQQKGLKKSMLLRWKAKLSTLHQCMILLLHDRGLGVHGVTVKMHL